MQEFILGFIIVGFLVCLIIAISHAPIFPLKKAHRQKLKKNGIIHFTSHENAFAILKSHSLKGSISDFEKLLGPLIWTYEYYNAQEIEIKHDYLIKKKKGKDDPENFSVCMRITGFNDEVLSQTYTRHGVFKDKPIVFKCNYIYPQKIEIIKEWTSFD